MTNDKNMIIPSSFRDPAGFLFRKDGRLLRQVDKSYSTDYDVCVSSGLYDELIGKGLLIPHQEVEEEGFSAEKYKILAPEELPYISYPYEWSFSQLKSAALLTLNIHQEALKRGMCLKDATAFNVQFRNGRPIFIDTLSFEQYQEGMPWIAYRQFCQHFLAPLVLMAFCDIRMGSLAESYIDGVPLDLASRLLPTRSYFKYSVFAHIHMHAKSQLKHQDDAAQSNRPIKSRKISKSMQEALIASLISAVNRLSIKDVATEWGEYYDDTNYSDSSMSEKENIIDALSEKYLSGERIVHDLGANTGRFSRIVARHVNHVMAHDIDEMAVERHYRGVMKHEESRVLPLRLNLTNPTPALGWDLNERDSFHERVRGSAAIALALIHHLCITNNVPLPHLAKFFGDLFNTIIIEFVPKQDSQVRRLLATRKDIFDDYTLEGFERAFSRHFEIVESRSVSGSERVIYAMRALS